MAGKKRSCEGLQRIMLECQPLTHVQLSREAENKCRRFGGPADLHRWINWAGVETLLKEVDAALEDA